MKILLIEDDLKTAEFIAKGLDERGFRVMHLAHGEDGLFAISNEDFDLAIIDLMLPGTDGLKIIAEARRIGKKLPIIILSARSALSDRLQGFEHAIDDYITKPFSLLELYARINAVLRRSKPSAGETLLEFEQISINLISGECLVCGNNLELQPKEFKLLRYFLQNPKHVLTKTMLLEQVWGYDFIPEGNVVEVAICRLRNKIEESSGKPYIQTLRGLGYVLR